MTWSKVLDALVSPAVFGALLVLIGVAVTAAVTTRVARGNRESAEKTAFERLSFEAEQGRRERLLEDKKRLYVESMKLLFAIRETHESAEIESSRPYDEIRVLRRQLISESLLIAEQGVRILFIQASNLETQLRSLHVKGESHDSAKWITADEKARAKRLEFQARAHADLYGEPLQELDT